MDFHYWKKFNFDLLRYLGKIQKLGDSAHGDIFSETTENNNVLLVHLFNLTEDHLHFWEVS